MLRGQKQFIGAQVAFCRFDDDGPAAPVHTFPGDYALSPSISVDGDGNVYVTYCDSNGDIQVWRRAKDGQNFWERCPVGGPPPYHPTYNQIQTFCECWGDSIFVGWCEEDPSGIRSTRDVFRRSAYLPDWPDLWWQPPVGNITDNMISESPTIAEGEFLVFAEQRPMTT